MKIAGVYIVLHDNILQPGPPAQIWHTHPTSCYSSPTDASGSPFWGKAYASGSQRVTGVPPVPDPGHLL